MKKLLLSALAVLPLLLLAPGARAQDYTYNCLCLYSDPRGVCREYTCNAYQNSRASYYGNRYCDDRYGNCGYSPSSSRYWSTSSQYYDSRYDYDWYYRRYTVRPSYYNYPSYNSYEQNYPYYY